VNQTSHLLDRPVSVIAWNYGDRLPLFGLSKLSPMALKRIKGTHTNGTNLSPIPQSLRYPKGHKGAPATRQSPNVWY